MAACDVRLSMVDESLQLKSISLLFTLCYLHCQSLGGPSPIAQGSVKVQTVSVFLAAFPES